MSLNWNITEVVDCDEIKEGEAWEVTNALIWATIPVMMGKITEANAEEFFTRVRMYERARGTFLWENGEPYFITLEDVQRRVGLTTNVVNESKTKFQNNLIRILREDAEIDIRLARI